MLLTLREMRSGRNKLSIVEWQMAEIWQKCLVCYTGMKFGWGAEFCVIL